MCGGGGSVEYILVEELNIALFALGRSSRLGIFSQRLLSIPMILHHQMEL